MNACFVEVRDHRIRFGEAAITVNLRGDASPGGAPAPNVLDRAAPVLGRPVKKRFNRQIALGR